MECNKVEVSCWLAKTDVGNRGPEDTPTTFTFAGGMLNVKVPPREASIEELDKRGGFVAISAKVLETEFDIKGVCDFQ